MDCFSLMTSTGHNYYASKEKEHSTLSGIYSQLWFQGMMLFSSVV